ncbi:hypothetical protein AMATHDRAFT_54690 [Amanita thiersii Skay4041]|uniref:non-specific serine/threonine protein kinase n=1 Tax=Amanita thiersii Skay4041 TaxID=703135 RepID=A0A2A9NYF9_9AGAR|nr:hypothetical protein AMATHDRAFT_54690 [Amanita thiersii Skay4041]
MTNLNSGSKRAWDGVDSDSSKRARGREDYRDWKDVHLRTPSRRSSTERRHSRDRDLDSRRTSYDRRYDRRDRDLDHRRSTDYGRGRDRSGKRDERDWHKERERERRGDMYAHDERSRITKSSSPRSTNGHVHPPKDDSEREEGEISPTRSSPGSSRDRSTPPSDQHVQDKIPVQEEKHEMDLDIVPSPPPVEDILAARRARRQAILAKYSGAANAHKDASGTSSAVQPPPPSSSISDPVSQTHSVTGTPGPSGGVEQYAANDKGVMSKRESMSTSPTPRDFALEEDGAQVKLQVENGTVDQVSAADYDPSLDRREDEQKRIRDPTLVPGAVEELLEEDEEEVDDMFAIETSEKKRKVKKVVQKRPVAPALITTTLDSAADPEGYYTIILGEQLDGGRYQVFSSLGKGMFANVVRARVLQGDPGEIGKEVAIKIIRCQESMYKAGLKETQILTKLRQADPEDKKHIVRLERTFEHRGHLCLVFESLSMNLRDVVKRFGKDVGLNIRAVRAYAHQLFLALSLLKKTNIMHADIKPDNILVNEQKTLLKLCDLGSASDASENEITPYLVSRFYRAPEIILGVPYDPALDVWSVGCTLYELYTGKILLPGRSNNQMLLLMMELKGRFNSKMVKKARFGDVYFDEMGAFESVEKDRVTGADVIRKVHISKPTRDLRARLMPPTSTKLKDDENKLITSFIDLLDKCLALDPARRISPREALAHPFIRG